VRIAIGSDHSGVALKAELVSHLEARGFEVEDFGTHSAASVDYPDFAQPVAEAVAAEEAALGVVLCSNGVGVSIVANKVAGVRAGLCGDPWSSRRAREHTNCNVLAIGAGLVGPLLAIEILDAFVDAEFQGGRHARRVAKVDALDGGASSEGATAETMSGARGARH